MICKIFFYYSNDDWNDIQNHLDKHKESYEIVSTDPLLDEYLKKNGYSSKTLLEIFPFEAQITYEVNIIAKNFLEKLRKYFSGITFHDYKIFSTIERQLLTEIVLIEKARKILEQKKNIIFIFKGYSFSYFTIQQLSFDMDYEISKLIINLLQGRNIKKIKPDYDNYIFNLKNKIKFLKPILKKNKYKSQYNTKYQKTNSKFENEIKTYTNFKINSELNKNNTSRNFISIKLIFYRFLIYLNINLKKSLLKCVDKKINNSRFGYTAKNAFFLSPSRDDELLAIYNVINEFNKNKFPIHVFVFDLVTESLLVRNGISYVSFSNEAYLLSKSITRSKIGIELLNRIKEEIIIKEQSLLHINNFWNPLLNQIFYPLAILIICESIFKKMNLSSIVVTDGNKYGNAVVLAANKTNLTSFSIISFGITPEPIHAVYHANKLCVYGLQGFESLTSIGYPEEKIIMTGNPRYDYLKNIDFKLQRKLLGDKLSINEKRKIIVVGLSRWYKNDEIWISDFIKFCNTNDLEIIIKVHPFYKITMQDEHKQKVNEIAKRCKNKKYLITYDIDPSILLPAADLVITDHSNLGIEAILLEKPLITVNFTKEPLEIIHKFFPYNASVYTENYNTLERDTLEILKEGKHFDKMKEGRVEAVKNYNIYNDGKASKRIFNLLFSGQ